MLLLGVALGVLGVLVIAAGLVSAARDASRADAQGSAPVAGGPKTLASDSQADVSPQEESTTQRVRVDIGDVGYEPSLVRVKAGSPVQLTVERGEGCAAGFLIPQLDVEADNSAGPATVELGALKKGTYRFTCAMEMVEGRLVVE